MHTKFIIHSTYYLSDDPSLSQTRHGTAWPFFTRRVDLLPHIGFYLHMYVLCVPHPVCVSSLNLDENIEQIRKNRAYDTCTFESLLLEGHFSSQKPYTRAVLAQTKK